MTSSRTPSVAYAAVRERVARGGPGWTPKIENPASSAVEPAPEVVEL